MPAILCRHRPDVAGQLSVLTTTTSTLISLSETWDATIPDCGKNYDRLSPWKHNPAAVAKETMRAHRALKTKKDRPVSSAVTSPSWMSSTRRENEAAQNLLKKSARFRGALTTVLNAERRQPVEESFQHFERAEEYIEHYRASRHSLCHWATRQTPSNGNGTPRKTPQNSVTESTSSLCRNQPKQSDVCEQQSTDVSRRNHSVRVTQSESTSQERHRPCEPSVKMSQSQMASQSRREGHVNMAVTGNQMKSDKNNLCGERGRKKISWGVATFRQRRAHPPYTCRKLFLTWRQYRKYFLAPTLGTSSTCKSRKDSSEPADDSAERGGYVERSATPTPSAPCRPTSSVPVLDYDQSRVGSPASPFQVDQSARRTQSKSAAAAPKVSKSADTFRRQRPQTDGGLKWRQKSSKANGGGRPDMISRSRSDLVGGSRPRLTICTAVDIQEAVHDLAMSLGNKKPLTKIGECHKTLVDGDCEDDKTSQDTSCGCDKTPGDTGCKSCGCSKTPCDAVYCCESCGCTTKHINAACGCKKTQFTKTCACNRKPPTKCVATQCSGTTATH